jgi:hypothetical protein
MRYRSRVLGTVIASVSLFAVAELASGSASAASQTPSEHVIVVFKNQDHAQPATPAMVGQRRQTLHSIQGPVLNQLSSSNARSVHAYTTFNAVSATVTPSERTTLRSDPAVSAVVPDQVIHLAPPAVTPGSSAGPGGNQSLPGACAPNGKVQLNPEALQAMSVDSDTPGARTARSLGITGAGVKVAFIADGLDINNPDFIRANGQHVFVDYKDFSGEGTNSPTGGEEAFGDAASIASQGRQVYDISKYSPLSLPGPCKIRIEGVSPGASLVGLDIFGGEEGFNSSFLQAIDYAVSVDHVNVLNESLGINNYPDDQASLDLIKQANDQAVAAGTTVTASSGDAGVTSTIGAPSSDPEVISAGASTTYRAFAQTGYGGARFPGVTGWASNNISSLSSGGFEQDGRTVDLVAPGELNWSLCSTNTDIYGDCFSYAGNPTPVDPFGGTSESAPLTAGVAALVIQAYEKTHGGSVPSPALVKRLIASTTDDIGAPAEQQGAGLADAYQAVLAAEAYNAPHGDSARGRKSGVVVNSETQLNATDAPGTPESLTDTITNTSGKGENLSLSTRAIGPYRSLKTATVTLSDSNPHITDWSGVRDNYQPVTFRVPSGEGRLNASAAFKNVSYDDLNARVRLSLVDPHGKLTSYSVPQGNGNYGNVQVAAPAAGTWTAYIYSRDSADGGTTGPVLFGAGAARYTTFGSISPSSLQLAPGQSGAATLHVSTPAQPGDASGAIVIGSSAGGSPHAASTSTTVPVTLRSQIPTGDQSFTDTLTGGNGRDPISGQEFYYQLNLPGGDPELNATVTLEDNPDNPFGVYLINPSGEAVAYATNMVPSTASSSATANVLGAQLHALNPGAGTWTIAVVFSPQVSGTALSEPFKVTTDQLPVPADAGGLPNASSTQLVAGHAYTYNVTVKNTGTAQESFFPDARLPGSTQLSLGATGNGPDTTEPLTFEANLPVYLVPTNSTALNEQATTGGSQPIQFDSQTASGDPDIASTFGTTAAASFAAAPIAQGAWDIAPVEYGPFGATGGPSEDVHTSASVTTSPFDPAVSSPTGDLQADSANPTPATLKQFAPITVQPGQTATIPVTVTPSGASGNKVSGTLYLDDAYFSEYGSIEDAITDFPQGNQVAAIPYAYTIK